MPIVIRWYQLPVPLRLSRATGGVVSVDYCTVSRVVIKANREIQTRETNREQSGGGKSDAGRESEECVMEREKKMKVHRGFYDELCFGVEAGDQKELCVTGPDGVFSRPVSPLTFDVRDI